MEEEKSDFISDELIGIEIDGKVFKVREINGEEADRLTSEYVKMDSDGNLVADIAKRNKLWLKVAVVDAPYEKEGKKFKDLKPDERVELLERLKPKIRIPLIQAVSDINVVGSDVAKNYKRQS